MRPHPTIATYYDLLAVAPSASRQEIADALVELRKIYDLERRKQASPEAAPARAVEEVLRTLLEAEATLLGDDPAQRRAYDRELSLTGRGYVDPAGSLALGRRARLDQVARWLDEEPELAAPLRDLPHPLTDLARPDAVLDEELT